MNAELRTKQQVAERANGIRDAKLAFARKHNITCKKDFAAAVLKVCPAKTWQSAVCKYFGGGDQLNYIIADLLRGGMAERTEGLGRHIIIDKKAVDPLKGFVCGRDDLNRHNAACTPDSIKRDCVKSDVAKRLQKGLIGDAKVLTNTAMKSTVTPAMSLNAKGVKLLKSVKQTLNSRAKKARTAV